MKTNVTLITGGSRSGKSRLALEKALGYPRRIFLATAVPIDEEMRLRIGRHRSERGTDFATVEESVFLAKSIRENAPSADVILVDCLTFWLNNLLYAFRRDPRGGEREIQTQIRDLLAVLDERPTSLIFVTNEVNMGVVPAEPLTRHFVDLAGRLNQDVARQADEVILMTAGIPQILKPEKETPLGILGTQDSGRFTA